MVTVRVDKQAEVPFLLESPLGFRLLALLLLLILLRVWASSFLAKPLCNTVLTQAVRPLLQLSSCLHRLKLLQFICLAQHFNIQIMLRRPVGIQA